MIVLFFIINSTLFSNNISCSNIPFSLIMQKDTIYTYNNTMSIARWPKGKENASHIKKETGYFQSLLLPVDFNISEGFLVKEVNTKSNNEYILQLLGKKQEYLPMEYYIPSRTVGILENNKNKKAQIIKTVKCGLVYKTFSEQSLTELETQIKRNSINKVLAIHKLNKIPVIHILSKTQVSLKGKMLGNGTETTDYYYSLNARELLEQKTTFKYEYDTGRGSDRYTEIISGEYVKKLIKKVKNKDNELTFPNITKQKNQVRFYTNNKGLFAPVTINTTIETKMYINTNSPLSFLSYPFYYQNFSKKDENPFLPVNSLNIANNIILHPRIKIFPEKFNSNLSYKIPGILGNDFLSKGILYINDKKRLLSFFESTEAKKELPQNAIIFKLINNNIVFDTTVNGTVVNTTLSFSIYEPEISALLQKKLNIKTRQFTLSKKDPEKSIIQKANIIFTPPSGIFSNTEVIVNNLKDEPFDLKLGLNFIKGKEVTINYKNKWLLIK